jgi:hypothetical protein
VLALAPSEALGRLGGLVNTPLLIQADAANHIAEPSGIDGCDLLYQDAERFPEEFDLGPERRGLSAQGRRRDQDD